MGASSRDWWDITWNPIGGCKPISKGCTNCFVPHWLKAHTHKNKTVHTGTITIKGGRPVWTGKLTSLADGHASWSFPLTYQGAEYPKLGPGKPSLIFAAGTGDLFIAGRPTTVIDRTVETIALSRHIGLFLSKYTGPRYRGKMAEYFLKQSPLTVDVWRRNIWVGFSAEGQQEFDIRWEDLRPLAAAGWFVFTSLAPLLEPVTLPSDFLALGPKTWVIANGEGEGVEKGAPERCRPLEPRWARAIRNQCASASIPFFCRGMAKGWPRPPDLRSRQFPAVP
jgi:protein gp37